MFLSAVCSLLRGKGFWRSLDVLYGVLCLIRIRIRIETNADQKHWLKLQTVKNLNRIFNIEAIKLHNSLFNFFTLEWQGRRADH